MTERLAEINARIATIHQLGAVVNALRGISAARMQQARTQLAAADAYAATIAAALSQALALLAPIPPPEPARGPTALVLFGAEQGFAGAFSEHILNAAGPSLATAPLFLIGTRAAATAAERGLTPIWAQKLPAQSALIPRLADQAAQALTTSLATGHITGVDLLFPTWSHGQGATPTHRRLLPLDPTTLPPPPPGRPLLNLPPARLLEDLTAEYLHAQLCQAALHSFAAENEARMTAMAAAHQQVETQQASLQAEQRQTRQGEITAEITELAAGESATRAG